MLVRGDVIQVEDAAAARARFPLDPLIDGSEPISPLQDKSLTMNTAAPIPPAVAMRVLLVSTLAFAVCFAAWMMFGVTGIPIRKELGLNASEFGLLMATPVLTGALFRLPLGIWTDRFGGRIVMFILLVGCAVPLWLSSYAVALWQFLRWDWRLAWSAPPSPWARPIPPGSFRRRRRGLRWASSGPA